MKKSPFLKGLILSVRLNAIFPDKEDASHILSNMISRPVVMLNDCASYVAYSQQHEKRQIRKSLSSSMNPRPSQSRYMWRYRTIHRVTQIFLKRSPVHYISAIPYRAIFLYRFAL